MTGVPGVIARWLDRNDADRLIRHGLVVLIFTNMGSVTNLFFHMIMGRELSESEYAVLASLLGVYLIFTVPIMAIQQTLAHFSGHLLLQERGGDIRRLASFWLTRLLLVLLPLAGAGLATSPFWAARLHLASAYPVGVVVLMILLNYFLAVYVGALQGMQSFFWMCVTANTWTVIRLVLGYALVVLLGAWAIWGLAGHLAGMGVSLLLGVALFARLAPPAPSGLPLERSDAYMWRSMLALFFFAILMSGDIVLVKLFFPEEADYAPYARASTIARTLIFLCQPIAGALFPKVISKGARSSAHVATLWKAIGFSALIIGTAVLLCVLFPRVPLWVLYDQWDAEAHLVSLVRRVALAMAPLGLAFILLNFEMAQHRFGFLMPLGLCALCLLAGSFLFHATLAHFVIIYSLCSLAATICLITAQLRHAPEVVPPGNGMCTSSQQED